jgi:predicted SnoaL-like aldol condensation-catalyzing enzyme
MNRGPRWIGAAMAALLIAGASACGSTEDHARPVTGKAATGTPVLAADPATEQKNSALVHRLYDEVFTGHKLDVAPQLLRKDYIQHTPSVPWGVDGFTMFYRDTFFKAFPDVKAHLDHVITQGNEVFTFATWTAKKTPNGAPLHMETADVYRVQDGLLAEHWDTIDYSALTQFGFAPPTKHEPVAPRPPITTDQQRTALNTFNGWLKEFIGQKRLESAPKYVSTDFKQHELGVGPGISGLEECFRERMNVIPDLKYDIKQLVTDGKNVGIIWVFDGTSQITHQRFEVHTADIYSVDGQGKLSEHWTIMDYTDLPYAGIPMPQPYKA